MTPHFRRLQVREEGFTLKLKHSFSNSLTYNYRIWRVRLYRTGPYSSRLLGSQSESGGRSNLHSTRSSCLSNSTIPPLIDDSFPHYKRLSHPIRHLLLSFAWVGNLDNCKMHRFQWHVGINAGKAFPLLQNRWWTFDTTVFWLMFLNEYFWETYSRYIHQHTSEVWILSTYLINVEQLSVYPSYPS